jgi:hypothetical protein
MKWARSHSSNKTCEALNEIGDPTSRDLAVELVEVILAQTVTTKLDPVDRLAALLFSKC